MEFEYAGGIIRIDTEEIFEQCLVWDCTETDDIYEMVVMRVYSCPNIYSHIENWMIEKVTEEVKKMIDKEFKI